MFGVIDWKVCGFFVWILECLFELFGIVLESFFRKIWNFLIFFKWLDFGEIGNSLNLGNFCLLFVLIWTAGGKYVFLWCRLFWIVGRNIFFVIVVMLFVFFNCKLECLIELFGNVLASFLQKFGFFFQKFSATHLNSFWSI